MRNRNYLFLLLCVGICWNVEGNTIQGGDDSELPPIIRSQRIFYPVANISQSSNSLNISFNFSFEQVEIILTDESGMMVYQTITPAIAGEHLTIDTFGWVKGTYTLTLINGDGNILQQEFIGL